jgi:haloalkane dehalogenase
MSKEISADFPFQSRFVDVNGSKIHYVEEGSGDPVLFLHGNPTSSYLWRNIIPHVSKSHRAIAMDLIGMGKSDKPDVEYRFFDHYTYVDGFIKALDLKKIVLVIHDWGSGLGLHYARQNEGNVKAIAMMESILAPVPTWEDFPAEFIETFKLFRTPEVGWDMIGNQHMFVERIDREPAHVRRAHSSRRHRSRPFGRGDGPLPRALYRDGQPQAAVALAERAAHRRRAGPAPSRRRRWSSGV